MTRFSRDGLTLSHPDNWTIEQAEDGDGWTITVQSPETAFVLLSFRPDAEEPAQLADETLAVLKDDYPELDSEDRVEKIAGQMAIGHDIDFIALDATVMCRTRCLEMPGGPLLILQQYGERDDPALTVDLQTIVNSIEFDEE